MDKLVIRGGRRLSGRIPVYGAKNAALPILASCLLSDDECIVEGVPDLKDVDVMLELMERLGVSCRRDDDGAIHTKVIDRSLVMAPWEIVRKMRASVCLLGPLVGRRGTAIVSMPGGCVIGTRPIDLHIKGLRGLGAIIGVEGGYVHATAERLQGTTLHMGGARGSTVLGTANVLMAAVLARGTTIIDCAAQEPEIVDLIDFLAKRGAKINGAGTSRLVVEGVERLSGGRHRVIPDRIEAATFLVAGAITGGDIVVSDVDPSHLRAVLDVLSEMGVGLELMTASRPSSAARKLADIRVQMSGRVRGTDLATMPYPHFPTDAQAQVLALATVADGVSRITDRIYPDRFMHVAELVRMGADVTREGDTAIVRGVRELSGAPVTASDLRASAALVLAGLVARGETHVHHIHHIDRGYERIDLRLNGLGASVERVKVDDQPEP